VNGPTGKPHAPWHNAVLKTTKERDKATKQVRRLGLPLVQIAPKNWDTLAALDCILNSTSRNAKILDAGAETYSRILPWLFLYGYHNLEGINIVLKDRTKRGPMVYRYGDVTATDYPDETFDAIACLSVVEHGVDLDAYCKETSRILKPNGVLVTSTDYWQEPIDTHARKCSTYPFVSSRARNVHWQDVNLDYTFVVFTLKKLPKALSATHQR
jgi:SAM-dependent methyltransferase